MSGGSVDKRSRRCGLRRPRAGLTLLELLVVIAIVMVLLALLGPLLGHVAVYAYDVRCRSNLHQLYQALTSAGDAAFPTPWTWVHAVRAADAPQVLQCPLADPDEGEPPLATIVSGVEQIDPPGSVIFDALESNSAIRMFAERENFTLPSDVSVNISRPGTCDSTASLSPSSVPSGTVVNCYFLHFDPVGSGPAETSGTVTFGAKVLGLIVLDGALNASDKVLGAPGTRYPTGQTSRGFELGAERVTLRDDECTLVIHRFHSTFPGEQVRILTVPAGGAASYGMNREVPPTGASPRQVLLLEYGHTITDFDRQGKDDDFGELIRPRHDGRVNVLFVQGNVETMAPEDLDPAKRPDLWYLDGKPPVRGTGDPGLP